MREVGVQSAIQFRPASGAFIIDNFTANSQSGIGGAKNLLSFLGRFEQLGLEWTVFTRSPSGSPRVVQVGPPYRKRGYGRKLLFSSELWKRRSLFDGMDFVYSQSASSLPFLFLLRRSTGMPTLFDCRNSFIRGGRLLSAFHLLSLSLLPPSRIVFVDRLSYSDYARALPRRGAHASYIPVPVAVPSSPPRRVRETVHQVLFATQLSTQKGLPELLRAADQLWRQGAGFTLHIAGDGPLKGLAESVQRRWRDRIILHGFLAFDEVETVMESSDIVVQPSLYEGTSVTVLEALATGVPAIATGTGGMSELERADVIECVAPHDPSGLMAAMRRLIVDKDRRQSLSDRGWNYVNQNHELGAVIDSYWNLLTGLGGRSSVNAVLNN